VEYKINQNNTLKLNVDNLLTRSTTTPCTVVSPPGDERSVRVTLTAKFQGLSPVLTILDRGGLTFSRICQAALLVWPSWP
jgi:hypothetical protein